jgi:hypothetical protein
LSTFVLSQCWLIETHAAKLTLVVSMHATA